MTKAQLIEKIQELNVPGIVVSEENTNAQLENILQMISAKEEVTSLKSELESATSTIEELSTSLAKAEAAPVIQTSNPVVEYQDKQYEIMHGVTITTEGESITLSKEDLAEKTNIDHVGRLIELQSGALKEIGG